MEFRLHQRRWTPSGKVIAMDEEQKAAVDFDGLMRRVAALEAEVSALRAAKGSAFVAPRQRVEEAKPASSKAAHSEEPRVVADARSLENRLGSQVFNRIGVVALLVGAMWFLKLAMDNHWVGPLGRVLIELVAGAGLVLWSERFRAKGFAVFSYSLKAVGSGVLYLSLWSAFHLYGLLPAGVAFGAMVLVTAWNAYMAWVQDAEVLAAYAMLGGFATPLLLSTGGNHEIFIFSYILSIDVGILVLVLLKPWSRLLIAAIPVTILYFVGWYARWWDAGEALVTAIFVVLLAGVFVALPILRARVRQRKAASGAVEEVGVPLLGAAFLSLGLYSVLQDSGRHEWLPWLMVVLAAMYLGITRIQRAFSGKAVPPSLPIHLSLAIVFLTIAIPLKASGRWITLGWLAEGVALLWVSQRVGGKGAEASVETTLRWLGCGALVLGWCGALFHILLDSEPAHAFVNHRCTTAVAAIAASAIAVWLGSREHGQAQENAKPWREIAALSVIAINLLAVLDGITEIDTYWIGHNAALQNALSISAFLMAYGAALLAVGFWRRTAAVRWQGLILLVFTIGKVFLYDMRSLSQGYRVLSFLGLGVVLMTISFAYQKDWLALKHGVKDEVGR